MKFIVTTPTGKELIVDETHVCTKNSPLQCMKLPKEMIDDYIWVVSGLGYKMEKVE